MDYFEFLRRVFFFKDLDDEELTLVLDACHEERFVEGDVLFVEGSLADRFYIVIEGRVEVWKNYGEPQPNLLGVHGPGHFFGEMALVDELPRSATVVARDAVLVLFLYRDDFRALVRNRSAIALSIMTSMSFLVRSSNEQYVDDLRRRNAELEKAYAELEKAQAERIRNERLSLLGKFSSMILHDIRNPVSIIKCQLALMLMDPSDTARVTHSAHAAEAEVSRLERLAGEFLDYSRGEVRLDIAVVDPRHLLETTAASLSHRLESDGIQLSIESATEGPSFIDGGRMQRALFNLADNARKALQTKPAENRRLRLGARYEARDLVFEVEDNGTGMPDEIQAHIFEPFYSVSGSGGTGLGLLIVKNVVEAHGGTIAVASLEGHGTMFTIRIPRRT